MKRTIAIVAAASLAAASCASSYRPVIDMKGVDEAKFETDLAECRDLAQAEHIRQYGADLVEGVNRQRTRLRRPVLTGG